MKPYPTFRQPFMLVIIILLLTLQNAKARQIAMRYAPDHYSLFVKDDSNTVNATLRKTKNIRLNNINIKAIRNFMWKYKDVNNANWYLLNDGFIAKFAEGGATTSVSYKINGEWLYTITKYNEQGMPKEVRALVKSTYYDYTIVNVEEIEVPRKDSPVYLVYVQDAANIKVLRVCDGEMEILHDYTRG